ncbi:Dihydropteroate synthase [Vibrio stylophorae]|uniref:Dihydropteroate synthase n=1 Tax=Vibrio stylophorae TaxID=659351 RepID=A0ABM8ZR00_9VIBR|nr:dihydropteroate synthase [Vibrio stylophorae]CAH0532708.1 Dihydropteroate synthase [Vibrio stylophorae]
MHLISHQKTLDLSYPRVMGILNVTPDSFSDGGKYTELDAALKHVESMVKAGAAIIDIGGESTRPGADTVTEEQELERVVPVVEALRERFDCWLSVDTSRASVITESTKAGADMINDIRALQEPGAAVAVALADVPVCIMHMQGEPSSMQLDPFYDNLIDDIDAFFLYRIGMCEQAGIARHQIVLDPGFGFGKTQAHNYRLLANLRHFQQFGLPILAGMSRKTMIHKLLNVTPQESLHGSLACVAIAAMQGANILRVHDAAETAQVLEICRATLEQKQR